MCRVGKKEDAEKDLADAKEVFEAVELAWRA